GGCNYVGESTVNDFLGDSITLAKAGLQLCQDYRAQKDEAKRLADALFKVNMRGGSIDKVEEIYGGVLDFLQGNRKLDDGEPYLFCHSTWLELQTMSDNYRDEDGDLVYETDKNGVERPLKINQVPHMNIMKFTAGNSQSPYYSLKHHYYIFDGTYPQKQIGYCSAPDALAATQDHTTPKTLTICPRAWENPNRLRAQILLPVPKGQVTKRQSLHDITPGATTLFHELFHLVWGNEATTPNSGEKYGWSDMRRLNAPNLLRNPETFAWAAVAYDITMNDQSEGGHRTEFYSGYATRG
ncbi:hypothetical protein BKA59DRAFT_532490, partial [Fusarium tricinctum]